MGQKKDKQKYTHFNLAKFFQMKSKILSFKQSQDIFENYLKILNLHYLTPDFNIEYQNLDTLKSYSMCVYFLILKDCLLINDLCSLDNKYVSCCASEKLAAITSMLFE